MNLSRLPDASNVTRELLPACGRSSPQTIAGFFIRDHSSSLFFCLESSLRRLTQDK